MPALKSVAAGLHTHKVAQSENFRYSRFGIRFGFVAYGVVELDRGKVSSGQIFKNLLLTLSESDTCVLANLASAKL